MLKYTSKNISDWRVRTWGSKGEKKALSILPIKAETPRGVDTHQMSTGCKAGSYLQQRNDRYRTEKSFCHLPLRVQGGSDLQMRQEAFVNAAMTHWTGPGFTLAEVTHQTQKYGALQKITKRSSIGRKSFSQALTTSFRNSWMHIQLF